MLMTKETHPDIRRTLLLLKKDNQVLLAMKKRGFGAGRWNGVGGKLEPGETVEQALVRECQEEVGVTPLHYWPVGEHDFVQDADVTEPWRMYVYAYLCDAWEGEPSESEEMAPRWFDIDKVPYDEMWDDDRFWMPLVFAGNIVNGHYSFDHDDKLASHHLDIVNKST